jgi:tRNA(adenine34) deaminase
MGEKIGRRSLLLGGAAMTLLADQLGAPADAMEAAIPSDLDHNHFMGLALDRAKESPKYPFGAVIVNMKTKEVIAGGSMKVDKKAIWHGEMAAINACPDGYNWKDVCLYTTAESCPMCQSAILWSGIPLVIYGSSMPYLISKGWGYINIRAKNVIDASLVGKCKLISGVREKECNQLFADAKKSTT